MKIFTGSVKGVLICPGATELALMLSLAHSHAKFLASWFSAPIKKTKAQKKLSKIKSYI